MKSIEPKKNLLVFTCPHCKTVSTHEWGEYKYQEDVNLSLGGLDFFSKQEHKKVEISNLFFSRCATCYQKTVWINDKMVYPNIAAPEPNSEMPQSVLELYKEAESIYINSPRGAAALLRLSIQILCKDLGESGKNINNDIANLVKKGLPEIVQQSLDIVRVTGNDAVHPGLIDTDNQETVTKLFELINIIIEYMIALPKKVSGLYSSLPSDKVQAINDRDGK
ncbi:uncharacterized protein DUF4145 [Dysgonomonas alginatilytica]|uniref:Uncharacterized protein DUF4145 n=1 Tax=Dysgonomonas alginatilytica TaxID=1605892 RepID=A0A2V3PRF1_9BACT|nr:DUF4145 domain-containing protein [Dysgonomonas alginatilytica]PXV67346.1 uncharacterized protein DUF4145 [Dysgonomonas alginatilytica]